jgi:nucleoid-associated protein YgaU
MPTARENSTFPSPLPRSESSEPPKELPSSTDIRQSDPSDIRFAASANNPPIPTLPPIVSKSDPPAPPTKDAAADQRSMAPTVPSFPQNAKDVEPPKKFELTDQFPIRSETVESEVQLPPHEGQLKLHPPGERDSAMDSQPTIKAKRRETVVAWSEETSLWAIAQDHYGDGRLFRAVAAYNRLDGKHPEKGAKPIEIRLPTVERLRTAFPSLIPADLPADESSPDSIDDAGTYLTRPGDTLFSIARDELGQASRYVELIEWNRSVLPPDVHSATRLPGGMRLKLEPQ